VATVADLIASAKADSPWLVLFAGVLLALAGAVGRRLFGTLQRFGARLGALEGAVKLEATRRRQTEEVTRDHGIPLPYWPGDPAELYARRQRYAPAYDDGDQADDDTGYTREAPRVPVPPLAEDERARASRHRR